MYQSFDGQEGSSDSLRKWHSLSLKNLNELCVLDLGCNEGYFCGKARDAGAAYVVGVDSNEDLVNSAKRRFPEIHFENRYWDEYLSIASSDSFDVILVLSAFHYVENRGKFLSEVHRLLRPNGILILEVGIVDAKFQYSVPTKRVTGEACDKVWHLTSKGIRGHIDPLFSPRLIGASVRQPGDPIDRFVFHCVKKQPWVILILGEPASGKSDLASKLANGHNVVHFSIDEILQAVVEQELAGTDLMPHDLLELNNRLNIDDNLRLDLINCIVMSIPSRVEVLIIEGYGLTLTKLYSALHKRLLTLGFKVSTIEL